MIAKTLVLCNSFCIYSAFINSFIKLPLSLKRIHILSERLFKTMDYFENYNIQPKIIRTDKNNVKAYCLSDLHVDTAKNMDWCKLNLRRSSEDISTFTVLILPGDIATDLSSLTALYSHVTSSYDAVCVVPGNHELWIRNRYPDDIQPEDSISKLKDILTVATSFGVHIGPIKIVMNESSSSQCSLNGLWIVPLYSWYHGDWDTEPVITHPDYVRFQSAIPFTELYSDFSLCRWPRRLMSGGAEQFRSESLCPGEVMPVMRKGDDHDDDNDRDTNSSGGLFYEWNGQVGGSRLAEYFASINNIFLPSLLNRENIVLNSEDFLITFSHFLPRQELCPEKRYLLEPLLSRVSGSNKLFEQLKLLSERVTDKNKDKVSHLHLFGHTHIPIDITLDGVRYIQWSLGYYSESKLQCAPIYSQTSGPLLVFECSKIKGGSNDEGKSETMGIPDNLPSEKLKWSQYYHNNPRTPEIVDVVAPWLSKRIEGFYGLIQSRLK